jgi:hypothetical protein
MQLKIHSDSSYLYEPKAKSIIGGYFYLGNKINSPKKPLSNGPMLCHTMLIPQVRLAHKYSIPPWEMIHLPGGDNAVDI